MINSGNRTIMHIDVNSAFLSWTAVYELQKGASLDLRKIPSAIGGNEEDRKGIILAKSIPAKEYGVKTGEVIWKAKQKCPNLVILPPNYDLYTKCSDALFKLLNQYSPKVQRFSIDECFLDYTDMEKHFKDPIKAAHRIKDHVKNELGFTINIGIGSNKLTAKIASDFKKPDMVHTLYPEEIPSKMWPLPVEKLFMVGPKTKKKLNNIGIETIGDLANTDLEFLKSRLKSHGILIWQYANGIDYSPVNAGYNLIMKTIGNSTTTKFDIEDKENAYKILLSLTESVAQRLRKVRSCCSVISVDIKNSDLFPYSHQRKIYPPTNVTNDIYDIVKELFDECWKKDKIRHLGVRVSDLSSDEFIQATMFDDINIDKKKALDKAVDSIRERYGNYSIFRGVFLDRKVSPVSGGFGSEDYPVMQSFL